jgi:hypothetical protein
MRSGCEDIVVKFEIVLAVDLIHRQPRSLTLHLSHVQLPYIPVVGFSSSTAMTEPLMSKSNPSSEI